MPKIIGNFLISVHSYFLNHLSRITTSGRYIPEIDGLRFIAVSWVVLYHSYLYIAVQSTNAYSNYIIGHSFIDRLLKNGGKGVSIFFIISGFMIALPFVQQHILNVSKVSLREYFLRRLTRIEPPYIFAMLTLFALFVIFTSVNHGIYLKSLGLSLAYIHNFYYHAIPWLNEATWTLEIEIQFYLIAPLLSLLFVLPEFWRRPVIFSITAS